VATSTAATFTIWLLRDKIPRPVLRHLAVCVRALEVSNQGIGRSTWPLGEVCTPRWAASHATTTVEQPSVEAPSRTAGPLAHSRGGHCACGVGDADANSSPDLYPYLPRRMAAISGTAVMQALASPVATNASSTASEKHRSARLKLRSWLTAVGFRDVYVIRFNAPS
jgi:hypothetical protein